MCIPERSQIPGVEYKFLFALDVTNQDMFADNLLSQFFSVLFERLKPSERSVPKHFSRLSLSKLLNIYT